MENHSAIQDMKEKVRGTLPPCFDALLHAFTKIAHSGDTSAIQAIQKHIHLYIKLCEWAESPHRLATCGIKNTMATKTSPHTTSKTPQSPPLCLTPIALQALENGAETALKTYTQSIHLLDNEIKQCDTASLGALDGVLFFSTNVLTDSPEKTGTPKKKDESSGTPEKSTSKKPTSEKPTSEKTLLTQAKALATHTKNCLQALTHIVELCKITEIAIEVHNYSDALALYQNTIKGAHTDTAMTAQDDSPESENTHIYYDDSMTEDRAWQILDTMDKQDAYDYLKDHPSAVLSKVLIAKYILHQTHLE